MRATDFMTTLVVTVTAETPISEAGELLLDRGFSAVPVVDGDGRLIGIVSEADLLRGRVPADPRAHLRPTSEDRSEPPHTVAQVMTDKVFALPETADEANFAAAMIEHRFKSIPVVSGSTVVGIVSASDLLCTRLRSDNEVARAVEGRLQEYADGQDLWAVDVSEGGVTLTGRQSEPQRRIAVLLAETVPGAVRVCTVEADADQTREAEQAGASPRGEQPADHRGLRVMGLDECLDRLQRQGVGRFAFLHERGPVVLPVNYAVDHFDIVFRTTWGAKLRAAQRSAAASFEIDGMDATNATGWSVLVKGTVSTVYEDAIIIERLDALAVQSWAGRSDEAFWVRLRPDEITGRVITVGESADKGD